VRRLAFILFLLLIGAPAVATPQWMTAPPTPTLPRAQQSGLAPVNGVRIWYAVFGAGEPVLFLHGGLVNANYWGDQVPVLARHYRVIVMDSRGHGRSSRDARPIAYDLMASDVLLLLDYLHIEKTAIIGWSDGAIVGLEIAIHHPERLTKLFAFAANSDPSGVRDDVGRSPVFSAVVARAAREYATLSPTPRAFRAFSAQITHMWDTEPHFTGAQLGGIRLPVWIVDGDHDEAIKRENTLYMADHIPGACLLIQPGVGHFSFLQDPEQFTRDVEHFLARADTCKAGS
jgi:pimeloyl-ACP methyl ester carboxylesterase